MAYLAAIASGNFTSSSTWAVIDSNGYMESVAASVSVSTTPTSSNAFIPGAITISGILVNINNVVASPSGTFTVELYKATAPAGVVSGTTVTVNVSDLPTTNNITHFRGAGWAYFKFASPVTLLAATNYAVRLSASVNNQISVFVSASTNWGRGLVTTTTQAAAASDTLIIPGEYTGAGTNSQRTVTMDSTSTTTAYGELRVCTKALLNYGTNTSTNYALRITGNVIVTRGGEIRMGNSSSPIPDSSTARLEINCASNAQYGLYVSGGTLTSYGMVKTPGVLLAADASIGATSLTLSSTPTGWKNGDILGIANTAGGSSNNSETKALSADVSTTTASVAALTYAHTGSAASWVQADIINLTRNVVITVGATTSVVTFLSVTGYQTNINCKYTQLLQLGSTASTTAAIAVSNQSATQEITVDIQYCSLYQSTVIASSVGFYQTAFGFVSTTPSTYNFSNNVTYGVVTPFTNTPATNLTFNFNNNVIMRHTNVLLYDLSGGGNFDNNTFTSSTGNGVSFYGGSVTSTGYGFPSSPATLASSWRMYGNIGSGIGLYQNISSAGATSVSNMTFQNWRIFRNYAYGINIAGHQLQYIGNQIVINGAYIFNNATGNIAQTSYLNGGRLVFDACTIWAGSSTGVSSIISNSATGSYLGDNIMFNGCTFGKDPNGTNSANLTIFSASTLRGSNIVCYNSTFNGTLLTRDTTDRSFNTSALGILSMKEGGVTTANSLYANYGTVADDTGFYNTASPSIRLTPIAADYKCPTPVVRVPVASGNTCTVTVYVRKSAAGDGAAYTGAQPRLMLRANWPAGITSETVGATVSASTGVWEQLSYTTAAVANDCVLEFYVDCDGTAGWVNVDDWDTTSSNDSRGGKYWGALIASYVEPDFSVGSATAGGSYTFVG